MCTDQEQLCRSTGLHNTRLSYIQIGCKTFELWSDDRTLLRYVIAASANLYYAIMKPRVMTLLSPKDDDVMIEMNTVHL